MSAWAFIIGINQYAQETGLGNLKGAVADAADFSEWLLEPAGGGVDPGHLFFWSHPAPDVSDKPLLGAFAANPTAWPMVMPDFSRAPTAHEVAQGVSLVADDAVAAGARRLYVFLAGHGLQTRPADFLEDPQTCFVAGNYHRRTKTAGLVPCDDMVRMLRAWGPSELVVFVDACRSDAPYRVSRPSGGWDRSSDSGRHERAGCARGAQPNAVAFEVPHEEPTRGAFSKLVVTALREHRKDGALTFKDLEDYVTGAIGALVSPHSQHPDFDERPKPAMLVLVEGPPTGTGARVIIQFAEEWVGREFRLVGGPGGKQVSVRATKESQAFLLAPGAYSLESVDGGPEQRFLHSGSGDTHVVL